MSASRRTKARSSQLSWSTHRIGRLVGDARRAAENRSFGFEHPAKRRMTISNTNRAREFAMLIKVPSKETEAVVAALSQHVRQLPAALKRSLTWDRGLEMAKHKDFTVATKVQVYFMRSRGVPGNAAPTKTPICCCGNTSQETPTCLAIRKRSSTRSRCA